MEGMCLNPLRCFRNLTLDLSTVIAPGLLKVKAVQRREKGEKEYVRSHFVSFPNYL